MDPVTQGTLGANLSQSFLKNKSEMALCTLCGVLGGLAPDLDVLIRSSTDPLIRYEYHRQFTHSLVFIPFGALIVAIFLYFLFRKKKSFQRIYLYSFLGYATHALLDSCTTYGTELLWPFDDTRYAWNNISIIDPLYTLPLLFMAVLAYKRKSKNLARIAILYNFLYLGLGYVQQQRAVAIIKDLAYQKGHFGVQMMARPAFANLVLWRVLYLHQGEYHIYGVQVFFDSKIYPGGSIKALNLEQDFPNISEKQRKDVERYSRLTNHFLVPYEGVENAIGDTRYSILPNQTKPMWGIVLQPDKPEEHVQSIGFARSALAEREFQKLWDMILGR